MFEPDRYQHADPEKRAASRVFQAVQLTEDNAEDMAAWFGATATPGGVLLPSGDEVPFGHWIARQEGDYVGVSPSEFQRDYIPA